MDTSKFTKLGYWRENYTQYPNSVYNTAYKCFSEYKGMYPNMQRVLDHWFITIGNGYEWKNGALVDRWDEIANIVVDGDEYPANYENEAIESRRSDFYDFIIRSLRDFGIEMGEAIRNLFHKSIVKLWIEYSPLELDETEILERMADLGNISDIAKGNWYPLGKKVTGFNKYHELFATPDNVKEDWLDAACLTAYLMYTQRGMNEAQFESLPNVVRSKINKPNKNE